MMVARCTATANASTPALTRCARKRIGVIPIAQLRERSPHPALRVARATLPTALPRGGRDIATLYRLADETQAEPRIPSLPPRSGGEGGSAERSGGEGGSAERSEDEPGGGRRPNELPRSL